MTSQKHIIKHHKKVEIFFPGNDAKNRCSQETGYDIIRTENDIIHT